MSDFEFPPSTPTSSRAASSAFPSGVPAKKRGRPPQSAPQESTEGVEEEPSTGSEPADADSKPEYSPEELLKVFDEIIFAGEYSESFDIRGRLTVTFRTRTAQEYTSIQKAVDASGFSLISSIEDLRSIMSLQFALTEFQQTDLRPLKPEEKLKFIKGLAGPVVGVLLKNLSKFDRKVALACEEGEANF